MKIDEVSILSKQQHILKLQYPSARWNEIWFYGGIEIYDDTNRDMLVINRTKGFLTEGDVQFLWDLASSLPKNGTYLEIGSWMGLSTILTANALLANLNLGAKIFAVDVWDYTEEFKNYDEVKILRSSSPKDNSRGISRPAGNQKTFISGYQRMWSRYTLRKVRSGHSTTIEKRNL